MGIVYSSVVDASARKCSPGTGVPAQYTGCCRRGSQSVSCPRRRRWLTVVPPSFAWWPPVERATSTGRLRSAGMLRRSLARDGLRSFPVRLIGWWRHQRCRRRDERRARSPSWSSPAKVERPLGIGPGPHGIKMFFETLEGEAVGERVLGRVLTGGGGLVSDRAGWMGPAGRSRPVRDVQRRGHLRFYPRLCLIRTRSFRRRRNRRQDRVRVPVHVRRGSTRDGRPSLRLG